MKRVDVTITYSREFGDDEDDVAASREMINAVNASQNMFFRAWTFSSAITAVTDNPSAPVEYDGPPKTDDSSEHVKALAQQVNLFRLNRITKIYFNQMMYEPRILETIKNVQLLERVHQAIRTEAQLILGYNRPAHENDAEFYALCDAIGEMALGRIRTAFSNGIRD